MYAAFRSPPKQQGKPISRWRLVVPLLLVVALQVTLLTYVAVAWAEMFKGVLSTRLATFSNIPLAKDAADPSAWLMLVLTKISSLCALALYTHAEVQAAVELFEGLREDMQNTAADVRPSIATLLVPLLQLVVALITLFVQGVIFQTYAVPFDHDKEKYKNVMDAVLACVSLAFILEIDDRTWKVVQLMLDRTANCDSSQPVDVLANVWQLSQTVSHETSEFITAERRWQWLHQTCGNCICLPCRCLLQYSSCLWKRLKQLAPCLQCFLVLSFHTLLFIYECTFGMLLVLYATEFTFDFMEDSGREAAAAKALAIICFFAFQVVAGV
jgi:hypothetical protein